MEISSLRIMDPRIFRRTRDARGHESISKGKFLVKSNIEKYGSHVLFVY